MIRWSFLLICLSLELHAHTPNAYRMEDKHLINVPVLHLHEECSALSSYCLEGIYGHPVAVTNLIDDEWVEIETEDNYRGYARKKDLVQDDPRWRTSARLCPVSSVCGLVYPIADTEKPAILKLPYGSYVELADDYDSNQDRWLKVILADRSEGWIQRGDVEKPRIFNLKEMLDLAPRFKERPYIWGGKSSEGFDCSGYMQTLFAKMGVLLPRDSGPQAASDKVIPVDIDELEPGDLLFFGVKRITHVGMYTGNGMFIHSGVGENRPRIGYSTLEAYAPKFLGARRVLPPEFQARIHQINENIFARMPHSWRDDNPVPLKKLRYVTVKHWGFDNCVHDGELIVHQNVADEVIEIFKELYDSRYPIEKIVLIDAYEADDDLSCKDNNTSAFCSRPITGGTEWSRHSFGLAIDVNPLLNPYKKGNAEEPHKEPFLNRTLDCKGLIKENDVYYQAFTSRGWKWGGHWQKPRGYVDYQHFEKD